MLDVCEEALYLIRQDVTLPGLEEASSDTGMEWVKCRKALRFAASEVLSAHDWYFVRENPDAKDDVTLWPENIKKLLVYALARELSVQIAGRTEDLKNLHALYAGMLVEARIKDLTDEPVEDRLESEVVSAVVGAFSSEDKSLPRSIGFIAGKVRSMRQSAIREVVSAHPWSFALDEDFTPSSMLELPGLGKCRHSVRLAGSCLKVVSVYSPGGEKISWQMVSGEVRAESPVGRILFVRDISDIDELSPDAHRLVVLRLAADVTKSMGSAAAAELGEKLYLGALVEAKLKDTRESNPRGEDVWGGNYLVEAMQGRIPRGGRRRR